MLVPTLALALAAANVVAFDFTPVELAQSPLASPKAPCVPTISCQKVDTQADSCCVETHGLLVQTQQWSIGGEKNWTIHGLWPDKCDFGFPAFCDRKGREHTCERAYNTAQLLRDRGDDDTLRLLRQYWPSNGSKPKNECASRKPGTVVEGTDEGFWQYEWLKHGTCLTTLQPTCAPEQNPEDATVAWFKQVLSLYFSRPTYAWLESAGITPDAEQKYKLDTVVQALTKEHGATPQIMCKNGAIKEIWYYYNLRGSIRDGTAEFFAVDARDDSSAKRGKGPKKPNCPSDVLYPPKHLHH